VQVEVTDALPHSTYLISVASDPSTIGTLTEYSIKLSFNGQFWWLLPGRARYSEIVLSSARRRAPCCSIRSVMGIASLSSLTPHRVCCFLAADSPPSPFYVSPTRGRKNNPASFESPLQTIAQALELVDDLMHDSASILLLPGLYNDTGLVVGPR
jgi:hypothetical protein